MQADEVGGPQAVVLVFGHRLHRISLFVFKADALPWPTRGLARAGPA